MDVLLHGGVVRPTLGVEHAVNALAIKDGRVVATLREEDVGRYTAPQVIDLQGRIVVPGLVDSHLHLVELGRALTASVEPAATRPAGAVEAPPGPEPTDAELERFVLAAQAACLAAGLTSVHDAGVGERTLDVYQRLEKEGRLALHINVMLQGDFDAANRPAPWLAARLEQGPVEARQGRHLTIRCVHFEADGALGPREAALLEPYADAPGSQGRLRLSREDLTERARLCRVHGFQVATDAVGDAAARMVLDAYEDVLRGSEPLGPRMRLERAQVLAGSDLSRLMSLDVIASIQPALLVSESDMALQRLGPDRVLGTYASGRTSRVLHRVALGSDAPHADLNPFAAIHAAVTTARADRNPQARPRAHAGTDRARALYGHTIGSALAGHDDLELGQLQTGQRADFVVLPVDPTTCSDAELLALRPESTWTDGKRRH